MEYSSIFPEGNLKLLEMFCRHGAAQPEMCSPHRDKKNETTIGTHNTAHRSLPHDLGLQCRADNS